MLRHVTCAKQTLTTRKLTSVSSYCVRNLENCAQYRSQVFMFLLQLFDQSSKTKFFQFVAKPGCNEYFSHLSFSNAEKGREILNSQKTWKMETSTLQAQKRGAFVKKMLSRQKKTRRGQKFFIIFQYPSDTARLLLTLVKGARSRNFKQFQH